jgi:hypothetical protein
MSDEVFGVCEFRSTKAPVLAKLRLSSGTVRDLQTSRLPEGYALEGDIIVKRDLQSLGVVITGEHHRWPKRTVVFEIDPAFPNPQRVKDAIAHWEQHTMIRFRQRNDEDDFVIFRTGLGCSSQVGKQGGVQFVNLGTQCTLGNTIHEIGHTVGLWHEQSREDREDFLEVKLDNIDPGFMHNFDQHIVDGDDVGDYDYGSIMHYPLNAFAIDASRPTLVPKRPVPPDVEIGQRKRLSAGDIAAVAKIYAGM